MIPALLCVSALLCYSRFNITDDCPNGSVAPTLLDALKITEKLNDTSFSFPLREKYLNKSLRFAVDHDRERYNVFVMQHVKPKYLYCAMPQAPPPNCLALGLLLIIVSCCIALTSVLWRLAINYRVNYKPVEKNDDNNA